MSAKLKIKLIMIGAVGTAKDIIDQVVDAIENYQYPYIFKGIIIDSFSTGTSISGVPILGGIKDLPIFLKDKGVRFLFCIYKPEKMKERFDLLLSFGIPSDRFINFIHPKAYVAQSAKMGNGNIVFPNSSIHSDVVLGNFNIVMSNSNIDHDSFLGDGNYITPNCCIGSKVTFGNCNFIGLNSSFRESVVIGNNVFIGMNSMVLDNFTDCRIWGSPAEIKK